MDFQSAMETFAEAWVAANAGQQTQALALTRGTGALAAAMKSPSVTLADIAVKKEHPLSLSPPNPHASSNAQQSSCAAASVASSVASSMASSVAAAVAAAAAASAASAADEAGATAHRRASLQGVTHEKLVQLQAQQQQHSLALSQQQAQQQQAQQQQLLLHQHQQQQQLQQQQSASAASGQDEGRSPRYSTAGSGSGGGRQSSEASPVPAEERNLSSTASSQNPSLAATPKLGDRDAGGGGGGGVGGGPTVGSISCLPPSALTGVGVAGQQQQQPSSQAERVLPSPLDTRRDFDVSKVNAKSLPLHCVVESVHSLQASLTIDTRNPWKRRPNIETDSYVIVAAATPWSEIVQTALQRLGYSQETASTGRGSLIIKNWKPIPLEQISDNPLVPVCDIIGELTSVVTLRIVILRAKPSPFGEIKDKLLKLLVLQSHAVLRSTGCPLDEVTLSQICRSSYQNTFAIPGGEIPDDVRRKFDQWWSNQLSPQSSMTPKMLPFMTAPPAVPGDMDFPVGTAAVAAAAAAAAAAQAGLHAATAGAGSVIGGSSIPGIGVAPGISASRESLLLNDGVGGSHHGAAVPGTTAPHPNMMVHPAMHASMHHTHHHHGHHTPYPNQKTRMRTSFDPEMELPKLQKWFSENPHPSRQQIQTYVVQLNSLESRRGRKPLDVNNVVYWFKNARAAQKRAEMRGGLGAVGALGHAAMNGYLGQHGQQLGQGLGGGGGGVSGGLGGGSVSGSLGGGQQMGGGSGVGGAGGMLIPHDYLKSPLSLKSEDIDTMSQHSEDMDMEDQSRPCSPQLPLSLTTHERHRSPPAGANDDGDDEERSQSRRGSSLKDDESEAQDLLLNGSLCRAERSRAGSYNEEDGGGAVGGSGGATGDDEDERGEQEPGNNNSGSGSNNNANSENSSEQPSGAGQNGGEATNNNSNNNNSTSSNNNSGSSHPSGDQQEQREQQMQSTESPKRTTPKQEEDEDLDMDEDDDDNENDTSQMDDYRSPSPSDMAAAAAVAARKDLHFPMVPNSMFSQSFMYMSHYMPGFGQAAAAAGHPHAHHAAAAAAAAAAGMQQNPLMGSGSLNLSNLSNEERRKRNRTFIDPVTEVPKLEQWFAMNTHPSHNLILKYTEDLNTMPYRQKFPRLESKNVQFWFKNRRAKCKRLKMSLYDSSQCSQMSALNSFVHKYEERD